MGSVPLDDGQIAYAAYGEAVGGVNFLGDPLPSWEELPEGIQGGWEAAARAVVDAVQAADDRTGR